jgi:molybdopterin-guanine dinucleotide biosynthesis protein A
MNSPIPTDQITGLLLAGGRGTRMGGVDKGLQTYQGLPMALYTLMRLQPQVGPVMINANRNIGAYEAMGAPVVPDPVPGYAGPLAGMLAGLERCETPWLVTVPCDTPNFPVDLVERLARAATDGGADIAMAATREPGPDPGGVQVQPVFCLMRSSLLESLIAFVEGGGRKIDRWTAQHGCVTAVFDDASAFFNANTLQELRSLQVPR